jgi:hypothetical protein
MTKMIVNHIIARNEAIQKKGKMITKTGLSQLKFSMLSLHCVAQVSSPSEKAVK